MVRTNLSARTTTAHMTGGGPTTIKCNGGQRDSV